MLHRLPPSFTFYSGFHNIIENSEAYVPSSSFIAYIPKAYPIETLLDQ